MQKGGKNHIPAQEKSGVPKKIFLFICTASSVQKTIQLKSCVGTLSAPQNKLGEIYNYTGHCATPIYVPSTSEYVPALEKILWSEVGSKEDYEAEIGSKFLGEFVRKIVGLDTKAAE